MKNRFVKRIAAMFMAMVLSLTMGSATASVFAANPDQGDVLKVLNVESGATVTAYKIVKEESGKWVKASDKITIADPSKPTASEIADIAGSTEQLADLESFTLDEVGGAYQKSGKTSGVYLILVTGSGATLYNPMLVSIDYDGTVDEADAKSSFGYDGNVAYAKSSTPKVDKSNDKTGKTESGTTDKGTSVQVGDKAGFTIKTTIPSYSEQYRNVKFNISDTLDEGLTAPAPADVTVKVGGQTVAAGDDTYEISKKGNGFEIVFAPEYIKSLAALNADERAVEVTYNATVNENAKFNYIPNNNNAEITFTNNPDGSTGGDKDNSKIYTFGLDANLNGTSKNKNKKTHEVIKLDENGNKQQLSYSEDGSEETVENALADAVFGLYSDEDCKNEVKRATTSSNGYMEMTGLSEGTYYLKEISAPSGYVPNETVYTVTIDALYNEDGVLVQHTVDIADGDQHYGSTYKATYDGNGSLDNVTTESETVFIKNSKVPGLPSTGGMGTYIFTVIGVMIMATAVILLRRRSKRA